MIHRPKLLLVEDHAPIRRAMVLFLTRAGYEVIEADSVQSGLARVDGQQFALLDLQLPDGSGVEVMQRIREKSPSMRVAILTAALLDDVPDWLTSSADLVMNKPVDLEKLLDRLASAPAARAVALKGR